MNQQQTAYAKALSEKRKLPAVVETAVYTQTITGLRLAEANLIACGREHLQSTQPVMFARVASLFENAEFDLVSRVKVLNLLVKL